MEMDPDYIDPKVLRKRAKTSGGAGAKSGRPRVRRVKGSSSQGAAGIAIVQSNLTVTGLRSNGVGVPSDLTKVNLG